MMETMSEKPKLPKYCYQRGRMLWYRIKDVDGQWQNLSTGFTVDNVEQAAEVVTRTMREVELERRRRARSPGALTVREYFTQWIQDRINRNVASASDEKARIERYVLPEIGDLDMAEVRPHHAQSLVRTLRALTGENVLAPRTIHHIYSATRSMFESAIVDEVVTTNPIRVKRGELPKKVDADPEWRSQATYTVPEVELLIASPLLPVERRVQYALKALAGLRHGEVAALRWRHLELDVQPLARMNVVSSFCSRTREVKRTKTEATRAVPVHPALLRILLSWRDWHWRRIYGCDPTADDFVVPTRVMSPVNAHDAGEAMKDDLVALQMRVEAGTLRDRGGHDLRGWYKTTTIEHGADSLLVRRTTHAPPRDVEGGYQRFSWAAICREIEKLTVPGLDGDPLELGTDSLQQEKRAKARWNSATPTGFEGVSARAAARQKYRTTDDERNFEARRMYQERAAAVPRVRYTQPQTAARMIERAIRKGDLARALAVVAEMQRVDRKS